MDDLRPDAATVANDKQALRREMRARRGAISDRAGRSARLWDVLLAALDARGESSSTVLAFVGVGHEPDTGPLLERLRAAGHRVLLPRVEGDAIVAVEHDPSVPRRGGAYGIPEPVGDAVAATEIDLVLVPGLAFTARGDRLGQGGGFYDRFLPGLRHGAVAWGVGFREQCLAEVPTQPHDQTLDAVVVD